MRGLISSRKCRGEVRAAQNVAASGRSVVVWRWNPESHLSTPLSMPQFSSLSVFSVAHWSYPSTVFKRAARRGKASKSSQSPCWGQEWLKGKPHHCPASLSHFEPYFAARHSKLAAKLHVLHGFNVCPSVHRCLRSGIYGTGLELTLQNIPNFAVNLMFVWPCILNMPW